MEFATLEWVSRFNHHRLLKPIGYIPPAEAETNYYRQLASQNTEVVAGAFHRFNQCSNPGNAAWVAAYPAFMASLAR